MRRLLLAVLTVLVLAAPSSPAAAPDPRLEASSNVRVLTSVPIRWDGDFTATSIAAEGDRLFVGSPGSGRAFSTRGALRNGGFLVYRLTEKPPYAQQVGTFACPSSQEGGLSVWNGLVLQSVDPSDLLSNPPPSTDDACDRPAPLGFGGLRVVDVRDAVRPRQVDFEPLVCGMKNHALVPAKGAAYIYAVKEACPEALTSIDLGSTRLRVLKLQRSSRGVDLRLASQVVLPAGVDCHGWSVLPTKRRAVCYAGSRLALFDISDPANPDLLGRGVAPGESFQGVALSPDGRRLVTTSLAAFDECSGSDDAVGVLRTYDAGQLVAAGSGVPATMTARSAFAIPRKLAAHQPGGTVCASLSATVFSGRHGRVFAAVGWNTGGMTIVDLTSGRPREIAHFASKFDAPSDPAGSSVFSGIRRAVWYRGRIYAPELMDRLGLRVLQVRGLGLGDVAPLPRSYNPQTQGG